MSKYLEVKTTLTEESHLVSALEALGYRPVVHQQSVTLTDYHGGKRQAHIVIPKQTLGRAWGDIGFFKSTEGPYQAVIDDFDQRGVGGRTQYDSAWLGQVTQRYKEHQTMSDAQAKGYYFQERRELEDGKIQLVFTPRF